MQRIRYLLFFNLDLVQEEFQFLLFDIDSSHNYKDDFGATNIHNIHTALVEEQEKVLLKMLSRRSLRMNLTRW